MLLPGTAGTSVASEMGRPLWPRKAKHKAMQQEPLARCPGSWLPAAHWQKTQGVLTLQAAAAEGLSVGLQGSGLEACLATGDCQHGPAGWLLLGDRELGSCPQGNPAKGWGWVSPCHAWRHVLLTAPLQQHRNLGPTVWPGSVAGQTNDWIETHCRDAVCWKGVQSDNAQHWLALALEQLPGLRTLYAPLKACCSSSVNPKST